MALTKRTYVDGETIITAQNLNDIQDEIIAHESNKVPTTRTVNGKALSSNITLGAGDIEYNRSATYGANTVGKGIKDLNALIDQKLPDASMSNVAAIITAISNVGDFHPVVVSCDSALSKILCGHQSTGIAIFKGVGTRIDYECFTPSDGNIAIGTITKSSGDVNIINSYGNGVKTSTYAGRKISIIGDSISTFDQTGYKIDGYAMYYPNSTIAYIDQTWWYKAMMMSGASIEVNASYSNSRVTSYTDLPDFYERCSLLGNPETIFVELGTNDSTNNVDLGNYDFTTAYQSLSETTFRTAYIKGIKALQATYPNAEICAVILKMDNGYASSIKTICKRLNVRYFECNDYASSDQNQRHPNVLGMRQIASAALTDTKQNVEKTCFYLPAYTNRQFNGFGYLTNDAKEVRMNFPCVTPNTSDITLTKSDIDACICSLRFGDATYVGGTYDYGIYANSDSISITIQSGGQGLRISFIKNSTWANASYNNMPIVGQITIRFKVDI